jgi:hypothetical protein
MPRKAPSKEAPPNKSSQGQSPTLNLGGGPYFNAYACITELPRTPVHASEPVWWSGGFHGCQQTCYRRIAVSPDANTRVSSLVNLSRSR